MPAVGFGMGIERLIMVMENAQLNLGENVKPLLYIAPLGNEQYSYAQKLVANLRSKGVLVQTDIMEKSLKAQLKYADKMGFRYVVILGEDEIKNNKIMLKDMFDKNNNKEISIEELYTIFVK